MLMILSPSKNMEITWKGVVTEQSQPIFHQEAEYLISKLKKMGPTVLSKLMSLSPAMTERTMNAIADWGENDFPSSPAALAYTGEAFKGLDAGSFSKKEMIFANDHLRILSGLYGVLRPLDQIQPYRLEMGLNWKQGTEGNLYAFWKKRITENLRNELSHQNNPVLLNLASTEYYKAIDAKSLKSAVIHFKFLDWKNGGFKQIMTFTKQARGALAGEIIRRGVDSIDEIKALTFNGYCYNEEGSKEDEMIFVRKA